MKKRSLLKTMLLLCALIVGSSSVWAQVASSAPANGKSYVIAAYVNNKYYALPNGTVSGGTINGTEITLNAINKVNTTVASGKTWTLEEGTGDNAGKFYIKYTSGSDSYYLYKNGTSDSNKNFAVNKTSKNYWSFTTNGTGYTVAAVDRGSYNLNIQCNSGTFRCYSSATPIILLEIGNVPILNSITLSGTYKTEFYVGDEFTYDGLIVTATGEDNSVFVVTPTSITSPDMSTTGVKTITVTYTLNEVTKTATYDINVIERPVFTVSFSDGGSIKEALVGAGVVLPNRSNTSDYTFVGWSESNVAAGSSSATTIAAGETYHPTEDCTLYPVYSYTSSGPIEQWTEIEEVPTEGEYVIASDNNYAMKASISSSRFENVTIEINATNPATLKTAPESNYIWEISKPDDYFRIKNGSNYAGGTSSKNQGALLTSVDADLAKWTITYSNNEFAFANYGRSQASSDSGNQWLRNNGTSGWGTYSSSQDKAPRLFKKGYIISSTTLYTSDPVGLATISLNAACTDGSRIYGTYSNSSAFVVPAYLTVSAVSVADGKLVVTNYETGAVVKAETGVMVASNASGNHTITLSDETGSEISDNMLKPAVTAITADDMSAAAPSCKYYRLTMHNGTKIGFWWGAENGGAFALAANKAYLAVPTTAGAPAQGFGFGDETTGIGAVLTDSVNDNVIYDLSGRRVTNPTKGLYIMNGKKVIIK